MVRTLGRIRGRKRFQKMWFIAKALGYPIPENFVWGNFGVYSYELQSEIDHLVGEGLLKEINVSSPKDPPEYEYSLDSKGEALLEQTIKLEAREPNEDSGMIEDIGPIPELGNNELLLLGEFLRSLESIAARKLELLSSLLYLKPSEKNEESLISFLMYLKPQFTKEEIEGGLKEIESLGNWKFDKVKHARLGSVG